MIDEGRRPGLYLDVSPLLEPKWTGLSVFTRRLAATLIASRELDVGFVSGLARLPSAPVLKALSAGTGAYLADALSPEQAPQLPPVEPETPLLYPSGKGPLNGIVAREASTVHDLTTLFMPETHDTGNIALCLDHLTEELASDDAVFCVSAATSTTLMAAAPSVAPKIRLLPQYVDWPEPFALADRNLPRPPLPPYALIIGTIEPRKNLQIILDALDRAEVLRTSLQFVVVGRQGWLVETFLSRLTTRQRERVMFTGYVSEFVKYRLLRHAEFLVFPSLCEGFGIPALEAMSLGKAVLAARAGSLPEVVERAGVYFDPLSIDDFADAFAEIANPTRRRELEPLALQRARQFTPEAMAAPVVAWAKG